VAGGRRGRVAGGGVGLELGLGAAGSGTWSFSGGPKSFVLVRPISRQPISADGLAVGIEFFVTLFFSSCVETLFHFFFHHIF
jgi:hypothetical protein